MIQILEGLYLGNREAARDLARLKEAGITHVVNCADELPCYHAGELVYLALRLRDPDDTFHDRIADFCAFIDEARQQGRVLVHCFAAVSRSPAVVLAYLCHLGHELEAAAGLLGAAVWTDPAPTFLAQIAAHRKLEYTREQLDAVADVLLGRRPPWAG
jgi:hypothetical protein